MLNIYDTYFQILAILSLFILLFGLVSLFVKERLYLAESLVTTVFGIVIGPILLNIVDPKSWFQEEVLYNRVILELSRLIISLQVMAVGLSTPITYIKREWVSILMLLGPCMVFSWTVSSFAVWLVLRLPIYVSMMIGACLSPTDPVLANAVIKGKFANRYIPSHLRNLLSVESGANDGLGFPFLMLPVYLYLYPDHPWMALRKWALITWAYEVLLSILIGICIGLMAKFLLEYSVKYRLIDKESFLAYSIALALSITGMVALISSDDLLSVFIAGNVFAYDDHFHKATKDAHLQEVIEMLFNISYFTFLGTIFPWSNFYKIGVLKLISVAAIILLFRRLPFIMLIKRWIPCLKSNKEAFVCGWLGPMGVGAIFFAMVTKEHGLHDDVSDLVFTVVSFNVLASILVHGITVPISHIHLKAIARRRILKHMNHDDAVNVEMANDIKQSEIGTHPFPDDDFSNIDTDPYSETIDMRGKHPDNILKILHPNENTKKMAPTLPLYRYDTYSSRNSISK